MTIEAQLSALGLRRAGPTERGWVVRLIVDGQLVTVWATDGAP